MIPLMKSTFSNETKTMAKLCDFITKSKKLSMGEKCFEFEEKFSKWQGRKYCSLFNSGASANLALMQSIKNLGLLKQKDHVAFSALTWSTNVMPIIQMDFQPIPVDCSPYTLNIDPDIFYDLVKNLRIRCLFITNALGFTCDLNHIKKICIKENIILIEDNCESLGTELEGIKTGNWGLASTFSFFVGHHLSTIEGGMIATDNEELNDMIKIVRSNGWDRNLTFTKQEKLRINYDVTSDFQAKYTFYDLAYNLRPTEITGFLGLTQLPYLDKNILLREKNYKRLKFVMMQNPDLIRLDDKHLTKISAFSIPVICKEGLRSKYLIRMKDAGIETRPMIAGNIQNQPFYKKYIHYKFNLNGTDYLHRNGFYCANRHDLTESGLITIEECLR